DWVVRDLVLLPAWRVFMSDLDRLSARPRRITVEELRNFPAEERDRVLEAQARMAERYYRRDPELTAFETFGEGDLYDHDQPAEER
ncbi:MAG TPA: hypothetical protein VFT74_18560, partial [Isosphaeraceae bacterium]|nr:hypothetical protein [Isosphaeraceae bacterium]